jgi:hypothetical protein
VTIQDAKNVIVTIINQLRQGKTSIAERFDFKPYIGVDLEA